METLEQILSKSVNNFLSKRYGLSDLKLEFQSTPKDFVGDITLVLFPFLKLTRQNPWVLGSEIGAFLKDHSPQILKYNVVSGFLNMSVSDRHYLNFLDSFLGFKDYGHTPPNDDSPTIMVEFSSPNTNKPLHLGHVRNNLLGHSISKILEANGNHVIKTQIINDRGIHICKSMLAWQYFGEGETHESSGLKGDQLVGKYYVLFEEKYREQVSKLKSNGYSLEDAEKNAPILIEAKQILIDWEKND